MRPIFCILFFVFFLLKVDVKGQTSVKKEDSAKEFNSNLYKYNELGTSFFVTHSNDTIRGFIKTVKAKSALKLLTGEISSFVFSFAEGKEGEFELPISDIKVGYLTQKMDSKDTEVSNPLSEGFEKHKDSYIYVTNLSIKDSKGNDELVFVSLVNPLTSSKIKVFQNSATGKSSVNGGRSVVSKNYAMLENGEIIEVSRKGYKETVAKIFADCPKIKNAKGFYMAYENFSQHVFEFDRNQCN